MRQIALPLALVAGITLSACGGGGAVCPPGSTPAPLPECSYPNAAMPQMVYPAPNSTNVPDNFNLTGIIVADTSSANYNNSNGFYLAEFSTAPTALQNSNTDTISLTLDGFHPIPASLLPPQAAPATMQNPIYERSLTDLSVGQLLGTVVPQTRYYVYLQYFPMPTFYYVCYAVGPIGSFTTQ
jgi:hypothetical protein